jgi:hypothetical protein
MPAPTLDGTATGQSSATTTVAATLTTTNTNDIVCALVCVEKLSTLLYVTGITGGVTWQKRSQTTLTDLSLELWWGVSAGALSGVTITATFNAASDCAAILIFGVSGCNTAQPWDNNLTLPNRMYTALAIPSVGNISTSNANAFLIFAFGTKSGLTSTIGTVPTGFTQIGFRANGSGSRAATVGAAYRGVTATQTNQTFAWGSNLNSPAYALFDALTADVSALTASLPTLEVLNIATTQTTNTLAVPVGSISANDAILVVSYCEQAAGGPAITSVSGGSLTWALRVRTHGSSRGSLEVWSARSASALAASTVTISYGANFDACTVTAFSVANIVTSGSVFDTNVALPAVASDGVGTSWTPSVTAATTLSPDMVLAIVSSDSTAAAPVSGLTTPPTGYTLMNYLFNTVATLTAQMALAYQLRSTTLSSSTVAWPTIGDSAGTNRGGEYVVDALTAPAGGSGGAATQALVMVLA